MATVKKQLISTFVVIVLFVLAMYIIVTVMTANDLETFESDRHDSRHRIKKITNNDVKKHESGAECRRRIQTSKHCSVDGVVSDKPAMVALKDLKNVLLPPGEAEKAHSALVFMDDVTNIRKRMDEVIDYRNKVELKLSCATRGGV
jgi:hypothetical protein